MGKAAVLFTTANFARQCYDVKSSERELESQRRILIGYAFISDVFLLMSDKEIVSSLRGEGCSDRNILRYFVAGVARQSKVDIALEQQNLSHVREACSLPSTRPSRGAAVPVLDQNHNDAEKEFCWEEFMEKHQLEMSDDDFGGVLKEVHDNETIKS